MPVEIIDHTADIRVRVYSHGFPSALLELSNYMLNLIYTGPINCEKSLKSTVQFSEAERCVVKLLSDILYYTDSYNLTLKVRYLKIEKNRLTWEACGEKFNILKHEMGYVIKGVAYDRIVVNTKNNFIEVTFDI